MPAADDLERCRAQFPALAREIGGRPAVYFDGPAGSQVPRRVVAAMSRYLFESCSNTGGTFPPSRESDRVLRESREAVAALLGAGDPGTVVFGPNMTTLTLALARALARTWKAGDGILLTALEHDANFTPWVRAAREAGAMVRVAGLSREDCTLDLDDLRAKLDGRTRLVAVTAASNASGSTTPIRSIAAWAHEAGALVFVDAVHLAPHLPIDVAGWDVDLLACSAYKFFGPHVGILWGRRELLAALPVDKLRPAPDTLPERWQTGTQNHEGIAGTAAAVHYLAELGQAPARGLREALAAGYARIAEHERRLAARLLDGLAGVPGVRVFGITAPERITERVPTVSFSCTRPPAEVAQALGQRGIFVWHGNFYALPFTEALGLEPEGLVRIGLLHYNTTDEVDRLLEALDSIL
jgi:cysteine desulfurase family protein (TIGR01976 family)